MWASVLQSHRHRGCSEDPDPSQEPVRLSGQIQSDQGGHRLPLSLALLAPERQFALSPVHLHRAQFDPTGSGPPHRGLSNPFGPISSLKEIKDLHFF